MAAPAPAPRCTRRHAPKTPLSLASSTKKIASIRSHVDSGGFCPYRLRGAYSFYTIDAALLTGAAYTRASRAQLLVGKAQNQAPPAIKRGNFAGAGRIGCPAGDRFSTLHWRSQGEIYAGSPSSSRYGAGSVFNVHPVLDTPSPPRWTSYRHTALRKRHVVIAYTSALPRFPRGYVDCVVAGSQPRL